MHDEKDLSRGPRVYVPPPLFYVGIFLIAKLLQTKFPILAPPFGTPAAPSAPRAWPGRGGLSFSFRP
jgi:hypothetical protein